MTNKSKNSTYRVFSYCKKNPGVLIAAGSAVITLATLIFNTVSYLMDRKYLNEFGYNISWIGWENRNLVYSIIWTIVWLMFSSLSFYYFSNSFKVFFNTSLKESMEKAIIARNLKQTKKKYRTMKKKGHKNQSLLSSKASEQLQETKKRIMELSKNLSSARETLRKKRKENLSSLFPFLFLGLFVQTILLFFGFMLNRKSNLFQSIFATIGVYLSTTILTVLFCLLLYFFLSWNLFNSDTKDYCKRINYQEDYVDEFVEQRKPSDDYLIELLGNAKPGEIFSDKNIIRFIKTCISNMLLFLFVFTTLSEANAALGKTFSIYMEDSTSYAIVYQSNGCAYMDQVDIVDDKIVFYTSKHRTVPSNDIAYEDIRFENVEMIGSSN